MIILDTDHCIAILRQKLDLENHVAPDDELFITSSMVSELTHGPDRSKRREDNLARLEVLCAAYAVLPFDEMAARRCGHLKAELEEQGEPLDDLDLQIASVALVWQCRASPLPGSFTQKLSLFLALSLRISLCHSLVRLLFQPAPTQTTFLP